MAFADVLKQTNTRPASNAVAVALRELSPEDAETARAALADYTIGATAIARAFKTLGHAVTERNVRTYREHL